MGEDRSRSRNANLLANLALIRNALLALLSDAVDAPTLPQLRESLHSKPSACYALLSKS